MPKSPKKNTKKKNLTVGIGLIVACGNMKMPITTAIVNMGGARQCPSARIGLCPFAAGSGRPMAGKCYALKAERMYQKTREARERQALYWLTVTEKQLVSDFLELIDLRSKTKYPLTAIRFNESGDLWGYECLDKLSAVAQSVELPLYLYSHRSDLFDGARLSDLPDNLTVNLSYWDFDKFQQGWNIFCLESEIPQNVPKRRCIGACHLGCNLCSKGDAGAISVALH